ncbi:hypothetical protein AAG570_007311 [Ranatra chinensis]|uniref:F-box domain-containing protein n=1 Tax=Ranatra chinensis TaxID=642074 RepID=A0ABD0YJ94_9HEMI
MRSSVDSVSLFRFMEGDGRMDILGELPSEIGLEILELLGPEDLSRCLAVSKKWRISANKDLLWRRFCRQEEWVDDAGSPKEPPYDQMRGLPRLCFWATLYSRLRSRVRRNWKTNRHKRYIVEPGGQRRDGLYEDAGARVLASTEELLVIGVERPPGIDLYSVLCTPRHVANIPPPLTDAPVISVSVTSRRRIRSLQNRGTQLLPLLKWHGKSKPVPGGWGQALGIHLGQRPFQAFSPELPEAEGAEEWFRTDSPTAYLFSHQFMQTPTTGCRYVVVLQQDLLFFLDRLEADFRFRHFAAADRETHRSVVYPMDVPYLEYALQNSAPIEYFTSIGESIFVELATGVFQLDCRGSRPFQSAGVSFFAGRRLFKDALRFYVLEEDVVTVLEDGRPPRCHRLHPPAHQSTATTFFSNSNLLVVLCKVPPSKRASRSPSHVFAAYDIGSGVKISETSSWKPYGYALHPKRDVLACSTKRYDSTDVLTCLDLRSGGDVLWDLPEPTGRPLARQDLQFVQESLLVSLPRADWEIYTSLRVIDSWTGTVLYTLEIEGKDMLAITDRLIAYMSPDDKVEILTFRL